MKERFGPGDLLQLKWKNIVVVFRNERDEVGWYETWGDGLIVALWKETRHRITPAWWVLSSKGVSLVQTGDLCLLELDDRTG